MDAYIWYKRLPLSLFSFLSFFLSFFAEAVDGDGDEKKDTMPLLWRWEALA